jgi:hypothetical protein
MTILPLTYLGGVEWFARLAAGGCVIDIGENWVKQNARNRAEILTANGVAALTVPVHGYGAKIAMKNLKIDNSKRWQHNHWMSIVSAYRAAPFFEHYADRFAPVYERRWERLVDLDLELLDVVSGALKLPPGLVKISENWIVPAPGDLDLRGKKSLRRGAPDTSPGSLPDSSTGKPQSPRLGEYTQVFHDRTSFTPGLSIIDLLFCEGPSAPDYLRFEA